ncbi:hypothetical protein B0I26_1119 [Anoxybacillus vitaminiphilus]|uniref:Uncharacterized protein n=1 Tax=Paranoxybacillus vitaminiphilus TaxID=581036 RepID=A0A327YDF8_9BACL|nr:hypothetical protein B0I26_1119 [Anoxybacillus vitaminiphilus]
MTVTSLSLWQHTTFYSYKNEFEISVFRFFLGVRICHRLNVAEKNPRQCCPRILIVG